MAYNELELKVIFEARVSGFGMYICGAWMDHEILIKDISAKKYPSKQLLTDLYSKMRAARTRFNIAYLMCLPKAPVNPMEKEQRAWQELSPKVKDFLNRFNDFIQGFNPKSTEEEQLSGYINEWWGLLQKWNNISESYKPKIEEVYSYLTKEGITEIPSKPMLSVAAQIDPRFLSRSFIAPTNKNL